MAGLWIPPPQFDHHPNIPVIEQVLDEKTVRSICDTVLRTSGSTPDARS